MTLRKLIIYHILPIMSTDGYFTIDDQSFYVVETYTGNLLRKNDIRYYLTDRFNIIICNDTKSSRQTFTLDDDLNWLRCISDNVTEHILSFYRISTRNTKFNSFLS